MRIAIVSDSHLTPRAAAFADNWQRACAWIADLAPDLVVHLGDISADGASDLGELEAARAAFDSLPCAFRALPGNHDIGDNPKAPGVAGEHPLDLERLADYRRLFGPDRWRFDAAGWQLVGLNAQLCGTGTDEEAAQLDWLAETLDRGSGPLGVMLHKPLCRDDLADPTPHGRYVPVAPRRHLLELLARRDLRFVLCGHTHQARRATIGPVEHVWAPSTAFVIPDVVQERIGDKQVGLLTLALDGDSHRFDFHLPGPLTPHDIEDFPQVYPGLMDLRLDG